MEQLLKVVDFDYSEKPEELKTFEDVMKKFGSEVIEILETTEPVSPEKTEKILKEIIESISKLRD
jgi:hypothetical protein